MFLIAIDPILQDFHFTFLINIDLRFNIIKNLRDESSGFFCTRLSSTFEMVGFQDVENPQNNICERVSFFLEVFGISWCLQHQI